MNNDKKYLFDNPNNVKRLLHILYACCAILVVLDLVIHRHTMHEWEKLWFFYPIYGFIGCVVLVIVATWMRTFLMRSEDYYDKPINTDVDNDSLNNNISNNNKLDNDTLNKKGEHHVDD